MLRQFIDAVTKFVTFWKRNQRVQLPENTVVKVNVGSGLFVADGWINVDGGLNIFMAPFPIPFVKLAYRLTGAKKYFTEDDYIRVLKTHRFIHHEMRYGLPFNTSTVDYVLMSHFLEHFYRKEADALLKEAYRILKPDGVLRVCVPDLSYAMGLYEKGEKESALAMFFQQGGAQYGTHRYMYDQDLLRAALQAAGFTRIEHRAYQQGNVPDLDKLDNRPEKTLYMEAQK